MKLGLLQINPTVGDLAGNAELVYAAALEAGRAGADLAVATELALCGYPPRDLVLDPAFVEQGWQTARDLAVRLDQAGPAAPPVIVGLVELNRGEGRPLHNSAVLLRRGQIEAVFRKRLLPTYDVFDEDRYFEPADDPQVVELDGRRLGVTICEDVWNDRDFWRRPRYHVDPVGELARAGVEAVINLSASPFSQGKQARREAMLSQLAAKHGLSVVMANQVGGNDELIFDGRSTAFDAQGRLFARGRGFEPDVVLVDLDKCRGVIAEDDQSPESEIWRALVLGVRDYATKCGFKSALLGLSGGIDSALTAAVAARALGPDRVRGVLMPSPYSSQGSLDDSLALAANLGLKTDTIPIEPMMSAFNQALAGSFQGLGEDVTEENIQARIRGNLLMSLSNKFGSLLLTTGNKSELAVGYCTLYGDMSGGLAVISDVPKTMVYRICDWLNQTEEREVIPRAIIDKPPSAELRPDQTDQDSLPPYDLLDAILKHHVEDMESAADLIERGFDPQMVAQVTRLVRIAEFKRRQAAPGLKVTERAFGGGWRMPIARR